MAVVARRIVNLQLSTAKPTRLAVKKEDECESAAGDLTRIVIGVRSEIFAVIGGGELDLEMGHGKPRKMQARQNVRKESHKPIGKQLVKWAELKKHARAPIMLIETTYAVGADHLGGSEPRHLAQGKTQQVSPLFCD